jgi:hypothetical protein
MKSELKSSQKSNQLAAVGAEGAHWHLHCHPTATLMSKSTTLYSFGNAVKVAAGQSDNDSGLLSDEDDDDVFSLY